MESTFAIVIIIGLTIIIFVSAHLRPLNESEVRRLGMKRRKKQVDRYFSFASGEVSVDREFKKRMNPNGAFYEMDEGLFEFPSIAAALLKYKKHEWVIIAFERQRRICSLWLNKGFDRSSVSPYLAAEDMAIIAEEEDCTSILIFHNHPNSNPNYYDCTRPSRKDLESANEFANVLNVYGINLIEFVCERGTHHEYFLSPADNFLPLSEFVSAIDEVNDLSKIKNLSLHLERIF
jgi:hypothetical protein